MLDASSEGHCSRYSRGEDVDLVAATDIVAEHKHGHGHGHGVELEGCAHCVVR